MIAFSLLDGLARRHAAIGAVLGMGIFLMAGCGSGEGPAAVPEDQASGPVAPLEAAGPAALASGQEVYREFCASCHDSGRGGAPVTGNPGDWSERSKLWQAVLMNHAKAGYLEMPAKGGESALSDLDVSHAVEYMLLVTYPQKRPD